MLMGTVTVSLTVEITVYVECRNATSRFAPRYPAFAQRFGPQIAEVVQTIRAGG